MGTALRASGSGDEAASRFSSPIHALVGLHRSAARAYSADGILANQICRGYIRTRYEIPSSVARLSPRTAASSLGGRPSARMAAISAAGSVIGQSEP